jgi:hypothetical protein
VATTKTELEPVTRLDDSAREDGLNHVFCCRDENLGLCGKDLTGWPIDDTVPTTCVVCVDLDGLECCESCPKGRG